MDEHHFELWANNVRRGNKIWYSGFRWGVFSGLSLTLLSVVLIGWLSGL